VQEYLANRVSPTLSEWSMPKLKGTKKKSELVRLPYRFKFEKQFKEPCQEWLEMIETMCNKILGNYTKKEDQLMTVAFGTRPKRRLNRVMDALNFEYPDYERLSKVAEGTKRKRVVSVLSRQTARMVKEDEEALKKRKCSPEPRVATSKKRRAATPEPKAAEIEEEAPSTPSAAEVEEILKVMTESLTIKLLSPLGPQLMKLLQKKDEPSAVKKAVVGPNKRRIVTVMQAIEETPSSASASKMTPAAEAAASTKAATAEATNLKSTLSAIDKVLLDLAAEETIAAAEALAAVPKKGKEIDEDASEEKGFNFQNLVDQELSKAEKEELQEYAISCGYQPGAMLFGGINEEALGCIRDRTGAKFISTLSKSVGFPKLEADISRYRRQHIIGSLFYSNFKVKFFPQLLLFCDEAKIYDEGYFAHIMLLSKSLRMQQDLEDKKNEIIIEGLEKKIKDHEASLEKKDFLLQTMEGSLAEAQAEIARLNDELLRKSERFEQEKKNFDAKLEAEVEKSSNLQKSLKELQDKCLNFGNQCVQRLKQVFNSVGASSEKFEPLVEDLPSTFEHIESEVEALDEVIAGHGDFCALLASCGTAVAFMKAGCTHGKIVNRPNFSLSPADLTDIPSLARSIGNRFITQIWTKGGRDLAGDEARSHLKPVLNSYLLLTFS
jgi:hypothetical protein